MNAGVFSVWAQNVTSPRRNARQRVRELLRDAYATGKETSTS